MRLPFLALALTLAAGAAAAQGPTTTQTSLRLATPANAPARIIIDGATWRCAEGVCLANGGSSQPAARACKRVVARLGQVSAFNWRGAALSDAELAACNA
ncbi:MAG TPA: hypothetical protein VGB49_09835 [Caulobacteraceae bacterium]|jgi:hypothetical protein